MEQEIRQRYSREKWETRTTCHTTNNHYIQ